MQDRVTKALTQAQMSPSLITQLIEKNLHRKSYSHHHPILILNSSRGLEYGTEMGRQRARDIP